MLKENITKSILLRASTGQGRGTIGRGTGDTALVVQVKNVRNSDGNSDLPVFDIKREGPAVSLLDACIWGVVNIFFIKSVPVKMLKTLPLDKEMAVHS